MRATLVMSTRWTVVTCAEVRLDINMCSAILMRMVLMGSMRVLACPAGGSGWRGWWCGRGGEGFHVLFGNPSTGASALHLGQIEIEVARHLAHQRRERTGGLLDRKSTRL